MGQENSGSERSKSSQHKLNAIAADIKKFADEMETWARTHIVLAGRPMGRASFGLKGLDIQPLLNEFAADNDLNSYGPIWTAFAFNTKFDDRVSRFLMDLPKTLAHDFSWGPRADFHQIYKVARRLDVLLIHEVTGAPYVLSQSVDGDGIPGAGLLAVLRYEIIRCAHIYRDFARDIANFKDTRHRKRTEAAERRLQSLEDVAADWEAFYENLKGGNICGLRKASDIENLRWFQAVLEYGVAVFRSADLDIAVTSAAAVDFARLKRLSQRPVHEAQADGKINKDELPRLSSAQNAALAFIREHGPVPGKKIAAHVNLTFEYVRKWLTSKGCLTAHGVVNDRNGDGYYLKAHRT